MQMAKVRELALLLFKLLRWNDAFDKRYCIFYTLFLIRGLHSCNYQTINYQIIQIRKLEKPIVRPIKSCTSSQTNNSPLKDADAIVLLFRFCSYRINDCIQFY